MKKFSVISAPKTATTGVEILVLKQKKFQGFKRPLFLLLILAFVAKGVFAIAPNPVNNGSDLNTAVTAINAGGAPSTITFESSPIDLSGLTLPTLGQNVLIWNFGSAPVTLLNSTGAAVSFISSAQLTLDNDVNLSLSGGTSLGLLGNGNGLSGTSALLNTGSFQQNSGSALFVLGGNGTAVTTIGNISGNGCAAILKVSGSVSLFGSNV